MAATGLLDIVEALADRTMSDEVRRIQVEFARLRRENEALKAERKSLLVELEQASTTTATRATCPPPAPAVSSAMPQMGELLEEFSFLQANLNHCARAQDLFLQSLAQWQVHVAVACEPYFVPPHSNWAGDLDGSVAVVVRMDAGPPLIVVERGPGYVVVSWREYTIVGVYFSPNRSLAEFETFLDSVRAAVSRRSPGSVLVLGDFNAKSRAWGCPVTDGRGEAVQVWGLLSGLSLLNLGTVHTCVRHNGGSIVDLSFATPAVARRVVGWRVEEDVETLSDHLYIRFEVSPPSGGALSGQRPVSTFPRWNLGRLDKELAEEAAIVHRWFAPRTEEGADTEVLAGRMHTILTEVCDSAMPRARRRPPRKSVYWWTPEIAELRQLANGARRAHARCRTRNRRAPDREGAEAELAELREQYRAAKRALQLCTLSSATGRGRTARRGVVGLLRVSGGRLRPGGTEAARGQKLPREAGDWLSPCVTVAVVGRSRCAWE
ncbi:uncharacterized protein LOC142985769 [Anticarsia gemmatalis]|uniref:uncharacterized protein LOC142985769 n=1 Tax=Anticarsia gemmatalis TaxID=129554 RepID=UPI003F774ADB